MPLLDQAAGGDDEHPVEVAAEHEFFGVQTGHDRLAGAGVIGEQEPQRGSGQELAVHRLDLVWQRVHGAGGHRDHRIVQACHSDAQGLGHQSELGGVGVELPATGRGFDGQRRFVGAVEQALAQAAVTVLVGHGHGVGAVG